jgi:hypothetical protein
MSRIKIPDHLLTSEQYKKRLYNERYRSKSKEKAIENTIEKKILKKQENITSKRIEKKTIFAMAGNDSIGDLSKTKDDISQSDFSNVFSMDEARNARVVNRELSQSEFSNEDLKALIEEVKKLRSEIADLQSSRVVASSAKTTKMWRFSIKNFLKAIVSFLVIAPIPALLVWQMQEMLELVGNRGGLILASGLEYAVLVAAGAAGLAKNAWQKTLGTAFVLALTATMAFFVVSGVNLRDVSGSETYRRLSEDRQMLVTDRAMLQDQLTGLPPEYKTKRSDIQVKIQEKTEAVGKLGVKLEAFQKAGGNTDPLATLANIGSRILLMLLEAWLVHSMFASFRACV